MEASPEGLADQALTRFFQRDSSPQWRRAPKGSRTLDVGVGEVGGDLPAMEASPEGLADAPYTGNPYTLRDGPAMEASPEGLADPPTSNASMLRFSSRNGGEPRRARGRPHQARDEVTT